MKQANVHSTKFALLSVFGGNPKKSAIVFQTCSCWLSSMLIYPECRHHPSSCQRGSERLRTATVSAKGATKEQHHPQQRGEQQQQKQQHHRYEKQHESLLPPQQLLQRRHLSRPPSAVPLVLLLLLICSSMSISPVAGQSQSTDNSTTTTTTAFTTSNIAGGSKSVTTTNSNVKWTFLIYMLADNNLECFGILDLIEMMAGMSEEPSGCSSTTCGADCPEGFVNTASTPCGGGKAVSRCCPAATYPDVLVLADRGVSSCVVSAPSGSKLDMSLLAATWTTAKELIVLPGGGLQQVRDLGEIDMAAPAQLAAFLQRAFARFPPSTTSSSTSSTAVLTRKYALVLWDHGNGWKGYGVDDTCSGTASISAGCDQFSIYSLVQGLKDGLAGQAVQQLDVLGFDACLMSMYEVAGAVAPYARTLLASEMLEPGHGWDYSALGIMTARAATTTSGSGTTSTNSSMTSAEVAMAEIWISQYKAQAVSYQTTGVTLALLNLTIAVTTLVPAVGALADALKAVVVANNSYASGVLRRRIAMAAVGTGEQESSVDLGDMLAKLSQATELDAASRAAATAAAAAYNVTLLAFGRDDSMPRGTGVAIYFPMQASKMDSDYLQLTSMTSTSAALAGLAGRWAAFLAKLYNASTAFASSTATFSFIQGSAASVPYIDVASGSYVMQGVLSSPVALSALSYYGFVDATDNSYILAGSQPAFVDGVSVLGTWRRLLWGITQTLNTSSTPSDFSSTTTTTTSALLASRPPPASSSTTSSSNPSTPFFSTSALMFASESWQTAADGATAVSVSLSANVRYGDTCSAARGAMSAAVLKYTYHFASGRATMQLFSQQASGAYGEVSTQAGGVIVPLMYKLPRDFSGPQTTTYQYSGCLKWGYNGTVRVVVVDMDSAADDLGVDVREDMLMFLVAKDMSLTKSAYLIGSFSQSALADTSVGGCQCLTQWRSASGNTIYSGCADPDGSAGEPWCPVMAGSCMQPNKARGAISDPVQPWDYCTPTRTLAGCSCASKYPTDGTGRNFAYGRCYHGDPRALTRGSWCTINATTCPTQYRAHGSNDTSYDYCETKTVEGCFCLNSWSYNNITYNGTCTTGFYPESAPEGFTNTSRWCQVQPSCSTPNQLRGRRIGLCGPAVPPVAGPSNITCALPASVWGSVALYDCVPWRNGPAVTDMADGIAPVCPLYGNATSYGTCFARNCTALDMSACPTTSPQATAQLSSSNWLARPCLEQLCAAALRATDNATCATDGARAAAAFSQLNASAEAAVVFRRNFSSGSLELYCTAQRGLDCLRTLMLSACPAIRLQGPAMYDTAYVDGSNVTTLCRADCVRALCVVASTRCARGRLVESLRLTLLEAMDTKCTVVPQNTTPIFTQLTASLMCPQLMAPPATCAPLNVLYSSSGNVVLGPVNGTSQYAPLTNCTWRIQPPGKSYITLSFSALSTEPLYDEVRVEDRDGVVAVVSGGTEELPKELVTDTGLLVLTFTSDSSIQMSGFTASFTATTSRSLPLPACGPRQKLVTFTMRTLEYANEISWLLIGFKVTTDSSSSNDGVQRYMVAGGGQLPAGAVSAFPSTNYSDVATDLQYRDARSYTTYACLPTGLSLLYMFDGYGDGWTGGSLTVSYTPTPTSSYELINASVSYLNATVPLMMMATMPATAADYSATLARNKGSGRFGVVFTLLLAGEVSGTASVSETKQLILRGAVSAVLSVDVVAISVQSVAAVGSSSRRSIMAAAVVDGTGAATTATVSTMAAIQPFADNELEVRHNTAIAASSSSSVAAAACITRSAAVSLRHVAAARSTEQGKTASFHTDEDKAAASLEVDIGREGAEPVEVQAGSSWRDNEVGVDAVMRSAIGTAATTTTTAATSTTAITAVTTAASYSSNVLGRPVRSEAAAVVGTAVLATTQIPGEKEAAVEAVEEDLFHGEGVVAALLARGQELGLRLKRVGEDTGGAAVTVAQRRHRGRSLQAGLTDLLAHQPTAASGLSDLVSVQQPYVLWHHNEALMAGEAAAFSSSSLSSSEKLPVDDSLGSNSAGSAGGGLSISESSSSSSSGGEAGNSSPSQWPSGYNVLLNGLLVGPDGVPIISKGESQAVAAATAAATAVLSSSSDSGAQSGNSGYGAAATSGTTRTSDGSHRTLITTEVTEVAAASTGGRSGGQRTIVRQATALDAMEDVVEAMHTAVGGSVRHQRGNGGRTPVPGLQRLLPHLLNRGALHLAAVAAATSSTNTDAAKVLIRDTAAVEHISTADRGRATTGDSDPGGASLEFPGSRRSDAHGASAEAGAGANAGGGAGADFAPVIDVVSSAVVSMRRLRDASSGVEQHPPSLAAAPTIAQSLLETESADDAAEDNSELEPDKLRVLHIDDTRRLLQQSSTTSSPSGVEVVLVVSGYTTQSEADTAAAKIQSSVSSDLKEVLGDLGWSYADPFLGGTAQVLLDGKPVTSPSTSGSSGNNWTRLAIIMGASIGGGLLLLGVVVLAVLLVRRTRATNGAKVVPTKTIHVAPAPQQHSKHPQYPQPLQPTPSTATSAPVAAAPPLPSKSSLLLLEEEVKAQAHQQMELQMRLEAQQAMMRQQHMQMQQLQKQGEVQTSTRADASLATAGSLPTGASTALPPPAGGVRNLSGVQGPVNRQWSSLDPAVAAAAAAASSTSMATTVVPMNGHGLSEMPYPSQAGMDAYMMAAMDPYGMRAMNPYGPIGMAYNPYGAYGDPYFGAYPAPPGVWEGEGAGMPQMGWR